MRFIQLKIDKFTVWLRFVMTFGPVTQSLLLPVLTSTASFKGP